MNPQTAERRPPAKGSGARTATESAVTTITPPGRTRTGKPRPPLAPASVYAPLGRRRWWWYAYRCRTCGAYQFGRSKDLDTVTGVRRAGCGHEVSVMIARTYGATS